MSAPLPDTGMLLLQLPTPSRASIIIFCFELTVYIPDFTTVVIKGNIDIHGEASTIDDNSALSSTSTYTFTPKRTSIDAEDHTILIAISTLCAIILTTLMIILLIIIVILRRKRKWRSGFSNHTSNIYE
jgi:hypothetical protein